MFTDFRVLTPVSSPCPHIPPPHPQTPFHFLSSLRSIHPGPRMPGVSLTSPYTVVPSDAMPDISLGRDYEHSRTVCSQILPTESQAQDPSRQGSKTDGARNSECPQFCMLDHWGLPLGLPPPSSFNPGVSSEKDEGASTLGTC